MAKVRGKGFVCAPLRKGAQILCPAPERTPVPRRFDTWLSCNVLSGLPLSSGGSGADRFCLLRSRQFALAASRERRFPPSEFGELAVWRLFQRPEFLHVGVSAQTPRELSVGSGVWKAASCGESRSLRLFRSGRECLSGSVRRPPAVTNFRNWGDGGGSRQDEEASEALRRIQRGCGMIFFGMVGVAFAFVPAYQMFCRQTGYGGAVREGHRYLDGGESLPARSRTPGSGDKELLTIDFASHCNLPWDFKPLQPRLTVAPGESALAFYRAKNKTNRPIIGMSLYHVDPPEAGIYFNKIQCFCFEEQLLNAQEEVDMPVFFFIDPDILKDSRFG